ncbi:MAG: undecaprenyl-diphosphatase UppP [Anaerolineales bacterium]|nr:MAG: undecaprenyl-diphosphatase UppP [Anaerolineales bacterium]
MTLLHALLLGIIQGLTEFIPVSSTAHLLIGQRLLGVPADDATFSFLVIVQLGTLVSLFAFYWKDLLAIVNSTFQVTRSMFTTPRETWNLKPETLLGWYIILATIPALLAGYLLKDAVQSLFKQPMVQASIRLFATAILLTLAELLDKKNRTLKSMTWLDAFIVGVFQIIAVIPGASRSGTTISGGMFRGFDRPSAARFAFLMSAPILLAAGVYEIMDVIQAPGTLRFLPYLAVGFVTAAVVGWFAIKWLIDYLSKRSLYVFAIYCAIVGAIVFLMK